jgi:protein-S-isoprenylcysteine O-methyltransferase Ste14
MNQDQTFQIVLIASCLIVGPIVFYHRLKSLTADDKLDRRQEGLFILATLRPIALAFWLGLIAYMVNPSWMAWSGLALPAWLRWTGTGAWAAAGVLLFWTLRSLGSNLTDTVVTRKAHTLITHGPYRWVRHPFYDSAALLVVASSLMAANWFLLVTGGTVLVLLVVRTRTEEDNLAGRFGDVYRAYTAQTGRFLPRIRTNRPLFDQRK